MAAADKGQPMVRWYDPVLLAQTGLRAAISTAVGGVADSRKVHAALAPPPKIYDHDKDCKPGDDFWFDYVADLGDGWQSTNAVARAICQKEIATGSSGDKTERGHLLIMGGDEVYPTPSLKAYHDRTIAPWDEACSGQEPFETILYALPGNHDWYDGLHAFSEIFCRGGRGSLASIDASFDCLKTVQSHSYFALKLPHDWWVCGIDIALNNEIDSTQYDFFFETAKKIKKGQRLILCAPTPSWVRQADGEEGANDLLNEIIAMLTANGGDLRLVVTGDLHHYSRYDKQGDEVKLITAGGGGAFMHPTHKLPESVSLKSDGISDQLFTCQKRYPAKADSRRLSWHNLLFPLKNRSFAVASGLVYVLLVWFLETRNLTVNESMGATITSMIDGHISVPATLQHFFYLIPRSPEFAIVVTMVAAALIGFNMTHSHAARVIGGLFHTLAHIAGLVIAYCFAILMLSMLPPAWLANGTGFIAFIFILFVTGSIFGGMIFGIYLIIALNVFNTQWTNAFSALRIANFKNFLRFKIDKNGDLVVYPYGIDDVETRPVHPHLIEEPFTIK
ncbi:MAG TPA: hypothetical protein ENJ55_01105 [Rhizobiales bacterium]|nr:hypothetical protein [Hyphomicrobiales bacterium]